MILVENFLPLYLNITSLQGGFIFLTIDASMFLHVKALSRIVLLILMPFEGCTDKGIDEKLRVNEVIYNLIKADNRSDLQAVLNSYTDSIEFYPMGKEGTKGIDVIKMNYEKLFAEHNLSLITEITDTKIFGDKAIVTGLNKGIKTSKSDSSMTPIHDKYLATLEKSKSNEWKINMLLWGFHH